MIVAWLLSNWQKVFIGLVIVACVAYVGTLKIQRDNALAKVAEIELELEGWKSAYGVMTEILAKQNKSILDLEKRTEEAKKKRVQADKKAVLIVRHAREQENAVALVPVAKSDECEAEMATIKQLLDAAE